MNKLILSLILTLTISACTKEAQSSRQTQNPEFKVDFLFEFEGCRVYRFEDGRNRYYANCKNTSTTEWSETCGKNCVTEKQVTTSY